MVEYLPPNFAEKFPPGSSREMGLHNSNKGLEGPLSVNAEDVEGARSAGFRHGDGGQLLSSVQNCPASITVRTRMPWCQIMVLQTNTVRGGELLSVGHCCGTLRV